MLLTGSKMGKTIRLSDITVLIRGGGEMASGVACRLYECGFRIAITEIEQPLAVRRTVSFSEAVYDGRAKVEGIEAILIREGDALSRVWSDGRIPLIVDMHCRFGDLMKPDVLVDAIIAKKNTGTSIRDAPLVIALGPGFQAGKDAHFVVETNRGHNLGRLLSHGSAESDTGIPSAIQGTTDRVLRAPADGIWNNEMDIGERVTRGDLIGNVSATPVKAQLDGVLRGMIRPGITVTKNIKIGDIDPRGKKEYCQTISDKARSLGGAVLEGIVKFFGS
jgi:xanthine dehydrogenase accessory factor